MYAMFSIISKCRPLTQFSDVSKTLIALFSQSAAVPKEKSLKEKDVLKKQILECRHVYPEFLPDPKVEFRNVIREKLERSDMVARRTQIDIGEFYVGKSVHRFLRLKLQRLKNMKYVTGLNNFMLSRANSALVELLSVDNFIGIGVVLEYKKFG